MSPTVPRARITIGLLACAVVMAGCGSTVRAGTTAAHPEVVPGGSPPAAVAGSAGPVGSAETPGAGLVVPGAPTAAGGGTASDGARSTGSASSPGGTTGAGSRPTSTAGPRTAAQPGGSGAPAAVTPAAPDAATAPGSSGSATGGANPSAPAPAAGGLADGRGVADGELRLGILTVSQGSSDQLRAMGFDASVGDPEANWRALLDDLNARGGLQGRTVVPEFAYLDVASTTPTEDLQAACTKLTQDVPVYAVISDIIFDAGFAACVQASGTPVVYPFAGLDDQGAQEFPLLTTSVSPRLDRLAQSLADGPVSAGSFVPADPVLQPTTIGVLRVDLPAYDRATRAFDDALAAHGLAIASEVAVSPINSGAYGDMASQIAAAVLQFRADGVTHVFFVTINATEPTLFMRAAESQGYEPRYGLSTMNVPSGLAALVAQSQIDDAFGIGWVPTQDVNAAEDPGDVPEQQACFDRLAAAGITMTSRLEEATAATQCASLGLVRDAVSRVTDGSGPAFVGAVRSLGDAHRSAATFTTRFDGASMGASAYRDLLYDTGCGCFAYAGPTRPIR